MKKERNGAGRNTSASVAENSKAKCPFSNPETLFTSMGITDDNDKEVMRAFVKELFAISLEYLNSTNDDKLLVN